MAASPPLRRGQRKQERGGDLQARRALRLAQLSPPVQVREEGLTEDHSVLQLPHPLRHLPPPHTDVSPPRAPSRIP
eukprot:899012-Rhodomonas_salina.1